MPIDLAKPRIIAFEAAGRLRSLTLKPITAKMWQKYFAGIINTQETVNGDVSSAYDSSGARLALLESALVDAAGYTPQGKSITDVEGWQAKLPMNHRRTAADILVAVERVKDEAGDDEFPELGLEQVTLKATWTAVDGRMQDLTGLVHQFKSPSAAHQTRYSRAMSRSIVVGGSRTGLTRFLGAQDVLIELYDELVVGVQGYTLNGNPLEQDGIAAAMDSYHKVTAATALFTPLDIPAEAAAR